MTQKEKNIVNTAIKDIKTECHNLEELYLQTRAINLRWVKQAFNTNRLGECLLFPSKQNRNWSKFKIPKDEEHSTYDFDDFSVLQNFLLKNHFDYCGLIPMGLALEATNDMYNIK